MKPLKGALIGFGAVAENAHYPAYDRVPELKLCAVVDSDPERRRRAEKMRAGLKAYASLEALYSKERSLDFIDIATPPFLHFPQALEALKRGLHVLCEKPLCFSLAEHGALEAAAAQSKTVLYPAHNWKYAPIFLKLRELLAGGVIGAVRHADWSVLRSTPSAVAAGNGNWRTDPKTAGGGILMDHGWHAFYLLSSICGEAPESVQGILRGAKGAEEEALCLISFPAATAAVRLTWKADCRKNIGTVFGEKGRIEILDDHLAVFLGPHSPGARFVFREALSGGSAHPDWFSLCLKDFPRAIQDKKFRDDLLKESRGCRFLLDSLYANEKSPS